MRVLILSGEFPPGPGGIGTHAYHIARELQRSSCQVLVMTPQDYVDQNEIQQFNEKQAFEIVRLRHLKFSTIEGIYRLWKVSRGIHAWTPDIILTTGERSAWILAIISRLIRVGWVAVGHGTEFGPPLNQYKKLTRWAFQRASAVICVSRYTQSVMHQLGITSKLERVIPNGADDEIFQPELGIIRQSILNEIGIPEQSQILLTVGNMTRRKGQEVVIRAMPNILKENPETRYLIAGLPTEKDRLEEIAIALGVADNILFLGRRSQEQLLQLYQACDIFLMTSRKLSDGDFEGFGISVIEAALCGKPAVVSNGSGLEEAVVNGVTGFCVPENNPEITAEAVNDLLRNSEKRLEMGCMAFKRAQLGYTWHIVGTKYLEFLREITDRTMINS